MAALQVVDDNSWEERVLKGSKPVLVDFFADWCGPCQIVEPALLKLSEEGRCDVVKARLEDSPLFRAYLQMRGMKVSALPTCAPQPQPASFRHATDTLCSRSIHARRPTGVMFVDGKPERSMAGVFNAEKLERFVAGDPVEADAAVDACVGGRCAPSASSGRAGALSRAAGKLMERLMAA